MKAVKLYGPRDLRVVDNPETADPGRGEILLIVNAVGISGSDLHMCQDGRFGDTDFTSPLVIGHEFSGEAPAIGPHATNGDAEHSGTRTISENCCD